MQRLGRNFSKSTQLFIDEQNKNRLQFRFCNKSKKTVVNLRIVVPAKAFQFTLFVVPTMYTYLASDHRHDFEPAADLAIK